MSISFVSDIYFGSSVFGFQGTFITTIIAICSLLSWRLRDSNSRPPACKAGALPAELSPHKSGSHLLSHAVSSIVPSAAYGLTIVFEMGTGVSRKRIATRSSLFDALLRHATNSLTLGNAAASPRARPFVLCQWSYVRICPCKHSICSHMPPVA